MKNKFTIIIIVFAAFLSVKCKNSNESKTNSKTNDLKEQTAPENKTINNLCFRNEYPFPDNSSMKDIQELTLSIQNEKVTGTYNWLPAQKDQRKGTLTGTIKNNTIAAQYHFLQEGTEATTQLTITLTDEKAEITGGDPQLGLNANIAKIDCNNH